MKGNEFLESILGQSEIFHEITTSNTDTGKYLIIAPPGQGKHYLIDKLASHYKKIPSVCSLQLSANMSGLLCEQDFAPFLTMLSSNEKIHQTNIIRVGKNFAALIPHIGKAVSMALSQERAYSALFSNTEAELLTRIERVAGPRPIVLLCEEIDCWDQPSIRFLAKLLSDLSGTIKMKFICTFTDSSAVKSLRFPQFDADFALRRISEQDIEHVIRILLPECKIDKNVIEKMYLLSKGNIGMIVQLSKLIDEGGTELIEDNEVYRNITLQKLRGVLEQSHYEKTVGLLDHASIIGESAYTNLLRRFTQYSPVEFFDCVRDSVENDILTDDVNIVKFNSKAVWLAFHSENNSNRQFHYELAHCILALMPSNYYSIGNELFLAGEEYEAAVHYILALLHYYHTYRVRPTLSSFQAALIEKCHLSDSYRALEELSAAYFAGDLERVKQYLYHFREPKLRFEADYMRALTCINGSVRQSVYAEARMLLESWVEDDDFRENSPFQWMKAALLTLGVQYELHDNSMSRLLKQIEKTKRRYITSDSGMERLEFDFLSKCNYCYSVDLAYLYTKQAADYFKRELPVSPSAYPYLVALTNVAANALVVGEYTEAKKYSIEALKLVENRYPSFGMMDAIINNLLIIELLNGEMSTAKMIDTAIVQLKQFVSEVSDDIITQILIRNNIAVMMCYKGDFDVAAREIAQLYFELQSVEDMDDYYLYLVGSNDCVLRYLTEVGDFDRRSFEKLCELQPLYHDRAYFSERNRYILQGENLQAALDLSKERWNDFGVQKVGSAWSFWGKWLLFSDIQIWSD